MDHFEVVKDLNLFTCKLNFKHHFDGSKYLGDEPSGDAVRFKRHEFTRSECRALKTLNE